MQLNRPEMVLFDFGGTLITEGAFSLENGAKAVVALLNNPPENAVELFMQYWTEANAIIGKRSHPDKIGLEMHLQPLLRNILSRAGWKTDRPLADLEIAFHRGNATHFAKEGIAEFLDTLHAKGIRTGVISNLIMSTEALTMGIDDEIPTHHFEYITTSADQIFCKPCSLIFEAAVGAVGLPASSCWYCGNDFKADVVGSTNAGLFAVFYDKDYTEAAQIDSFELGDYLHIGSWNQLTALVKEQM